MPTAIEDLVQQLLALSPSQLKAVLDKINPRKTPGPVALSQERVHQATWAILDEMTTIDGMPFDEWLMDLTHEGLEALKRTPKEVKNPALPGGAFVNQEGICLRFAMGCHSSPLFRAGHPGRSS